MIDRHGVYKYIIKYKRDNDGLSPSMREIMAQGVSSTSVVTWHLNKLEQEGKINCNGIRGIKVTGGEWRSPMKKYIDRGIAVIYIGLLLAVLIASLYFFTETRRLEQTVVQNYYWNDEWYTCKHTPGEMECWLVDDPNVGGGQE